MANPPEMLLIGGEVTAEASAACGVYRLTPRSANGRPVWRQVAPNESDRWIVLGDGHWFVLRLGKWEGSLRLRDVRCASPDRSLQAWEVHDVHGRWLSQPGLSCRSVSGGEAVLRDLLGHVDPLTPAAVVIKGGVKLTPEAASCCGWYALEPGLKINGRPMWSHAILADRVLAFDGASWQCQARADLGTPVGYLQLNDGSCAAPHLSRRSWRVPVPTWARNPSICCRAASACQLADSIRESEAAVRADMASHPPPDVLRLSVEQANDPYLNRCMGNYRLCPGLLINGRPAWRRHGDALFPASELSPASGASPDAGLFPSSELFLAYDCVGSWCVQLPGAAGAPVRLLHMRGGSGGGAGSSPLACAGRTWFYSGGGAGWEAIPGVRCEATPTLSLHAHAAALARRRSASPGGHPQVLAPVPEEGRQSLIRTETQATPEQNSAPPAQLHPAEPKGAPPKPPKPAPRRRRLTARALRAC